MANKNDELREQFYHSSPTPPNESVEFENFIRQFSSWSITLSIFITYLVSYFFGKYLVFFGKFIPFADNRIDFLVGRDQVSYESFVSTAIVGFFVFPFVVIYCVIEYWKNVFAKGKCKSVNFDTFIVMIVQAFGAFAFYFIVFVTVPESYDSRWPGMSRILFWPVFPALGAVVLWMVSIVVFSLVVGTLKFVYVREGQNG